MPKLKLAGIILTAITAVVSAAKAVISFINCIIDLRAATA